MPVIRVDDEKKEKVKEDGTIDKTSKPISNKPEIKKKTNKNIYPILYIICAIAFLGLGLLLICFFNWINYGVFTIPF